MAKHGQGKQAADLIDSEETPKDDVAELIGSFRHVTDLLTTTITELQRATQTIGGQPSRQLAATGAQINSWDDPFSEAVVSANPRISTPTIITAVTNTNPRLSTSIVDPSSPPGRYTPGTPEFRYWVASEALASGVNFWSTLLPAGATWSTTNPMQVALVDAGEQLNANYSRTRGLRFFRKKVGNFDIHASESPKIVCHELGHAVLDALRPQLFNAASTEVAAFHEFFGDASAILCALQLPSMRRNILVETGGHLNVNSRLSRVAEQLGWGIRQMSPTAVDRDCLRNAANRFFYQSPEQLPPFAPANLLSTEEHSFSRVFTGAFLDALAEMFNTTPGRTDADLFVVARDLGQLLVDGILGAAIVPTYFSQVAAAIVQADQARFAGRYRAALSGAFLQRGILSLGSTMSMPNAPVPRPTSAAPNLGGDGDSPSPGSRVVFSSYSLTDIDRGYLSGVGQTPELTLRSVSIGDGLSVEVHAADEQPHLKVESAMAAMQKDAGGDGENAAARLFVESLIQRRELDLGDQSKSIAAVAPKATETTHSLVNDKGKSVLKRNHFSCGCMFGGRAPAMSCN